MSENAGLGQKMLFMDGHYLYRESAAKPLRLYPICGRGWQGDLLRKPLWGERQSFRLHSSGRLSTASNGTWREEFADLADLGHEDRKRTLNGVAACLAGEPISMPSVADALAVQEVIEEILG